jgi:hypothetical protein
MVLRRWDWWFLAIYDAAVAHCNGRKNCVGELLFPIRRTTSKDEVIQPTKAPKPRMIPSRIAGRLLEKGFSVEQHTIEKHIRNLVRRRAADRAREQRVMQHAATILKPTLLDTAELSCGPAQSNPLGGHKAKQEYDLHLKQLLNFLKADDPPAP